MENEAQIRLEEMVEGFLNRTLDKALWTHEAHIITAIWHLKKFNKEDALCRLRSGIISYNLSLGGENTGQNGYHETMTIFWWELISQFVTEYPDQTFEQSCSVFLASPMADKGFPLEFYSKRIIFSPAARARFVNPDRKEIKII